MFELLLKKIKEQEKTDIIQDPNKMKINKIRKRVNAVLYILCISIFLFGVMTGIGSGYENSNSNFDFEPYAIAGISVFIIYIIFNIIMMIKYKK